MLCKGEWLVCDDGIARPIIRATILGGDGGWHSIKLLVDTGADKTVISADELARLRLPHVRPAVEIGGVGGIVDSVDVTTVIQIKRDNDEWIKLRGTYAACLQENALDMSVLGRDVLNNFAVIVDRPADRILLLHGADGYAIQRRT